MVLGWEMTSESRREPRYNIAVEASVRDGTDNQQAVNVTNLSAAGCRFASPDRRLRMRTLVSLSFGRAGVVDAKVRWRVGDMHGVRFDRPLQPAVLDHIRLFLSEKPALVAEREGLTA